NSGPRPPDLLTTDHRTRFCCLVVLLSCGPAIARARARTPARNRNRIKSDNLEQTTPLDYTPRSAPDARFLVLYHCARRTLGVISKTLGRRVETCQASSYVLDTIER